MSIDSGAHGRGRGMDRWYATSTPGRQSAAAQQQNLRSLRQKLLQLERHLTTEAGKDGKLVLDQAQAVSQDMAKSAEGPPRKRKASEGKMAKVIFVDKTGAINACL